MSESRLRAIGLRLAYAALFVVVLPALLVLWAHQLDRWVMLPVPDAVGAGVAVAMAGIVVMAAGTFALWRFGGGLPMSAFPPERLVSRGVYRYVADPLYVGAVGVCIGASLASASPAGLWIVSPLFALACTAWVMGFERERTRRHFGAIATPLLRLPNEIDAAPTAWQRAAVYAFVFIPWLVLYLAVEFLGPPPGAPSSYLPIEASIPVMPWTAVAYESVYPLVVLAPLFARRQRDLRAFARRGLWATAFILPFYLLVPVVAQEKPLFGDGFWQFLLSLDRFANSPLTAFPAFHVVWACIAAALYTATWRRGWTAWLLALAIGASCVTVGLHSINDVLAGYVAYVLVARGAGIWRAIRHLSEWGANSWREWSVGPVRVMSHGLLIGLAVFVSLPLVTWLGGADLFAWAFAATLAGAAAAALWAQLVEGSPQLLRPFGYFGGIIGVLATLGVAAMFGVDVWRFAAAYFTALTFGQGLGRLRCLVNGCCHGAPAPASVGITYLHPMPRPTRLAGLGGVAIHPTQIYALFWLLLVGAVLVRLWVAAVPLSFVAGMYFVLVGVGRFVEEHYRGEPQTAVIGGFRLYQWLTLLFIIGGATVSTLSSPRAPAPEPVTASALLMALACGIIGVISFGVDVPRSNRRFSRLA